MPKERLPESHGKPAIRGRLMPIAPRKSSPTDPSALSELCLGDASSRKYLFRRPLGNRNPQIEYCQSTRLRRTLCHWAGWACLWCFVLATPPLLPAAEWPYTTTRESFVFQADFPLDPNQDIVDDLVSLRSDLARHLQVTPCQERIDVYLFGDPKVYEMYMRRYFPTVTPRRAMFIKANSPGNVFAYISRQFDVDLRHEATHALLHATLPMVPLWLDEGLAEYFEMPAAERAYENPYLKTVRRGLLYKRPPALVELESFTQLEQMGPREYQHAWAWVHFMLHGPPVARQTLVDYLAKLERHEPPRPLSETLAQQLDSPPQAFVEHFRSWRR